MAVTTDPPVADARDDGAAGDDDVEYVPGVSYPSVVAIVVAVALLVGGATWWLTRPGTPGDPSAVDTGFALDMRTHHQQAIEMALVELGVGENPVVTGFAREILVRQNVELGLLAAELDDWGIDPTSRPETAMGWMGHGVPWREMPGLATEEELAQLRAASGEEADARFLELMAEHHRGGVHMAAHAAEHAETDDVRDLAAAMAALQAVEIDEYRATAAREGLDADIPPFDPEHDPFAQ